MRTANYPNHPLFRIAPLLDSGLQTVGFDPFERGLVAKIREGRYSSDLWDCNSLYLDYGERLDRHGASPADRQGFAAKSGYKMTPEQLTEYRRALEENDRALRAKLAEERKAREAEQERVKQEHAEALARRTAEREKRERDWAGEDEWRRETRAILAARWECSGCLKPATIQAQGAAYILECRPCGRSASADHATLVNMMLAHQARHQTASPG